MKNSKFKVVLIVFMISLYTSFSIVVRAENIDDYYEQLGCVVDNEYKLYDDGVFTDIGYDGFISVCIEEIQGYIKGPIKMLFELLLIITISGVYHALSKMIKSEKLAAMLDFCINICLLICIIDSSLNSIEQTESYIKRLTDFSLGLSPIMCGIYISCGQVTQASVTGTGISIFVSVCESIFAIFLLPLIKMMMAFGFLSCLNDDTSIDMSGFSLFIKRIFTTLLSFIVMLFSTVFSYQSITAASADTIGARTLRFAIGNLVPVVGAAVGEAVRTVGTSVSSLKNTVGGVGICVIMLILLPCVIRLLISRFVLWFASSVAKLISCTKEYLLLESISTVYSYCLSLVLCSGIMILFVLALFSNVNSTIIT